MFYKTCYFIVSECVFGLSPDFRASRISSSIEEASSASPTQFAEVGTGFGCFGI